MTWNKQISTCPDQSDSHSKFKYTQMTIQLHLFLQEEEKTKKNVQVWLWKGKHHKPLAEAKKIKDNLCLMLGSLIVQLRFQFLKLDLTLFSTLESCVCHFVMTVSQISPHDEGNYMFFRVDIHILLYGYNVRSCLNKLFFFSFSKEE